MRPISLLNVDYKLCARALAGRLLKVLHHVILPDQTCGVKGRFIGENVAFLRDVSIVANELNLPAAILSLDQEKAFDRVDWSFLLTTLRHMGFGESFVKWVQLLYTDIRSAVLIDGYTSNWFKPSRGVRQGCPLSPLLYVISIEVWQPISGLIPVSPASGCQTSNPLYPWYPYMRTIHQLLSPRTRPRSPFSKHILFLSVVRDLNSILASVRAFSWGRGAIASMRPSPFFGIPTKLKFLAFTLVMVTWMRPTGNLVSRPSKSALPHGVLVLCPYPGECSSSMRSLFPGFRTLPHWWSSPLGRKWN